MPSKMVRSGANLSLSRRSCGLCPGVVLRRSRIVIAEASKDSPSTLYWPFMIDLGAYSSSCRMMIHELESLSLLLGDREAATRTGGTGIVGERFISDVLCWNLEMLHF